ncbi:hypothetical protein AU476_27100 [Cupriavidus sp. UYMSc13B]|nr:hypothetical protein AU476_27100 [Cupriavidus sp. UYMSc13B]
MRSRFNERKAHIIDTDAISNGGVSYHDKWLAEGVAVVSDPNKKSLFGRVARGDVMLAYVKLVGIVAVGVVVDEDVATVLRGEGTISPRESAEYHRRVAWTADLRSKPVTVKEIIALRGTNPRGALAELLTGKAEILDLVEQRSEEIDLSQIERGAVGRTTDALALSQARRGQGKYRNDLLNLWERACAVTGCGLEPVLRASHALPWKMSSDVQRLDPNNGLPLIPTLDALFDAGLIGFTDEGEMLISRSLSNEHFTVLGLPGRLRRPLNDSQRQFLQAHRELFSLE